MSEYNSYSKSFLLPILSSNIDHDPYLQGLKAKAIEYKTRAGTVSNPEGAISLTTQEIRNNLLITFLGETEEEQAAGNTPVLAPLNPFYELHYRIAIIEAVLKLIREGKYRSSHQGKESFQPLLSASPIKEQVQETFELNKYPFEDHAFGLVLHALQVHYLHTHATPTDLMTA